MRKALKVRNNGKRSHAERNRETNWEGIGENISGEIVFDAVGVFF